MNLAAVAPGIALTALTTWACRSVVTPWWGDRADDTIERYLCLLGRRHGLRWLATGLTVLAFGAYLLVPQPENVDLSDLRHADASCGERESPYDLPTCITLEADGVWAVEELHADQTRSVIATIAHPPWKRAR